MNIVYKITYLPHINTNYPKYYIGSKFNYKGNYFGSIASQKKFEFTNGLALKDWWKIQLKENKADFLFEILEDCSTLDKYQLAECEKLYQIKCNAVLSEDYFNQALATGVFVGGLKDEQTRNKMSLSLKTYYQTPEGIEKRNRLIKRNKNLSSIVMKNKWQAPSEKMLNRKISGRPKGVKEKTKRNKLFRRVFDGICVHETAETAALVYGITPTSIRRRCRINYNNVWRYCE